MENKFALDRLNGNIEEAVHWLKKIHEELSMMDSRLYTLEQEAEARMTAKEEVRGEKTD